MLVRRAFSLVPHRAPLAAMPGYRLLCQVPGAPPSAPSDQEVVSVRVRLVEKGNDFCDVDNGDLPVVEVDAPAHLTAREHFPVLLNHPKIKLFVAHVPDPKLFTAHWEEGTYGLRPLGPANELHTPSGSFGSKHKERLSVVFPSAADLARPTSKPPPVNATRATPLILLDVDGVLNLLGESEDIERAFSDVVRGWFLDGHGMAKSSLDFSPHVIQRVNKWAELGAEVRWLTTWGETANAVLAPRTGVYQFEVCAYGKWGVKPQEVFSEFDLSRPVVWVDDDFDSDMGPKGGLRKSKGAGKGDLLLVSSQTHESGERKTGVLGLTGEMADEVDAFIRKWTNAGEGRAQESE